MIVFCDFRQIQGDLQTLFGSGTVPNLLATLNLLEALLIFSISPEFSGVIVR